jgi:branched-subunit amino acid aminotransferase/4-amino-4-deoxychorismate lyase
MRRTVSSAVSIPAAAVLHYAQEIFVGLKAYKRDDGGVNLFRPDANARRFWNSAEGMAMAPLPEPAFIEAVEQLVRIDRAWMPGGEPVVVSGGPTDGESMTSVATPCVLRSPTQLYVPVAD